MRIALITCPFGALPPVALGAVEKLFHQLAGEWVKSGAKVSFVCAGGGDNPQIDYIRLKRYERTGRTLTDLPYDFIYSLKALWKLPVCDVLVCNTFWAPVLAPLFRWKYKKLVYGVHRFPKRQFFLYPFVHKFICVSTVVANALKKQVAAKRVCVVVNPVDTNVFKPEPREAVKGRIMYAGRVHPLKGLRRLAEACSMLANEGLVEELMLVGPWETERGGGGVAFVEELKKRAGRCSVVLKGAIVDALELAEVERTAEVFVYPSEDVQGEAFGIAPLEAMALGIPTVVSDLECFSEFVSNGVNAFKFQTAKVEALTDILRQLLIEDSLKLEIGKTAASDAKRFSVQDVAKKYLSVFSDGM